MEVKRKQAPRLPKPAARYWKGKAPKGAAEVDSEDEDEGVQELQEEGDIALSGDQEFADEEEEEENIDLPLHAGAKIAVKSMNIALKDVNISKDGKVIVAGREESGRTALEEEESEEESEEEQKPRIPGEGVRARVTIAEKDALLELEEMEKKKERDAEERRKQSHNLVAESIKRELAEKEKEEDVNDVDDTDGLDPAAEFDSWRLRELGRIKKEKEEALRREEEREEIEKRRAMPEEQRMKEDVDRANKLREEKPKGQQMFLQKYWHKGAFHQDEEILKKRDYTAPTESTVDVSMLPKVMQVKNFGKRSRTKYTHLVDQDTTLETGGFGGVGSAKKGGASTDGGGCFTCGGPHLKKVPLPALVDGEIQKRDRPAQMMLREMPGGGLITKIRTGEEMISSLVLIEKARATGSLESVDTTRAVRGGGRVPFPDRDRLDEIITGAREYIRENVLLTAINDGVWTDFHYVF
ncbi:hypothetical protein H0H93_013081 [Arthromyces matolae]|nr:hypothetical protein H0H93_013081 [Arthromyces matolae]